MVMETNIVQSRGNGPSRRAEKPGSTKANNSGPNTAVLHSRATLWHL